jgi:ADP-heptose:LPS heptosyltransferase
METCPYLSHVLIEPKSTGEKLALLRERQYDAVFLLRKSVSMAALCRLAGVKQLIGYDKQRFPFGYKRWGWFLNHQARYPSLRTETPQPVSHLGLLSACGLEATDSHLELWATAEDEQRINALLQEARLDPGRPMAVLHAASASHGKQIELSKFSESLQRLNQAGYQLLATGTESDYQGYETLAQQAGIPLYNLAGRTSLRETFALYKRIQLLLTVDSSPIHLAAAANIPQVVGVFGPTNHLQWGPHNPATRFAPVFIDLPCRPCYPKVCSHNNCRTLITGPLISQAVDNLISNRA